MHSAVAAADAVVNATPIGMYPDVEAPAPIPEDWLRPEMLIYDMVYTPAVTRLLAAARERGCRTVGGLRMLVLQGAAAFTAWTGRAAPDEVMERALRQALAG